VECGNHVTTTCGTREELAKHETGRSPLWPIHVRPFAQCNNRDRQRGVVKGERYCCGNLARNWQFFLCKEINLRIALRPSNMTCVLH
jgi:hypothetical protein